MKLRFTKMHGAGNDFVFFEDLADELTLAPEQVRFLCDRHMGIGADGVIVVKPSDKDDCLAYMHYLNSDGTLAEMCGNGVRCFSKYLVDNRIAEPGATSLIADTLAGPRPIEYVVDPEGMLVLASVDMGLPITDPAQVPTTLQPTFTHPDLGPVVREQPIETPMGPLAFTCVSMGNPHAIAFVDDPSRFPVAEVGRFIEQHEVFPEKTNVEFASVHEGACGFEIEMRVWERGCGETLACGTGCCATEVAAALCERATREADLKVLGGTLHVKWDADTGHVIMTGPATTVYHGVIELPEG